MRKIAILFVLCFAVTSVFAGCRQASQTNAGTAQDVESGLPTEPVAQTDAQSLPEETGTVAADAQTRTPTDVSIAASGAHSSEKAQEGASSAQGSTTVSAGKPAVSEAKTPAGQAAQKTTASAASGNTTASSGSAKTTKAEKPTATTASGGSVTTKPSAATKPTETSTTKPSASTTEPASQGNAISGKLSYLNTANVTYLSALNAEDLKGFGIVGDKQKEVLKNKSDWVAYTIQIDFRNNTDKPLTIYYLDVTDNGKGDIYVCGDTAGELGMAANGKMSEKFLVLAKKDDADIEVREKLSKMSMRVQYAETSQDDTVTPNFQYSKIG